MKTGTGEACFNQSTRNPLIEAVQIVQPLTQERIPTSMLNHALVTVSTCQTKGIHLQNFVVFVCQARGLRPDPSLLEFSPTALLQFPSWCTTRTRITGAKNSRSPARSLCVISFTVSPILGIACSGISRPRNFANLRKRRVGGQVGLVRELRWVWVRSRKLLVLDFLVFLVTQRELRLANLRTYVSGLLRHSAPVIQIQCMHRSKTRIGTIKPSTISELVH
jgi:hypothetical protein